MNRIRFLRRFSEIAFGPSTRLAMHEFKMFKKNSKRRGGHAVTYTQPTHPMSCLFTLSAQTATLRTSTKLITFIWVLLATRYTISIRNSPFGHGQVTTQNKYTKTSRCAMCFFFISFCPVWSHICFYFFHIFCFCIWLYAHL